MNNIFKRIINRLFLAIFGKFLTTFLEGWFRFSPQMSHLRNQIEMLENDMYKLTNENSGNIPWLTGRVLDLMKKSREQNPSPSKE